MINVLVDKLVSTLNPFWNYSYLQSYTSKSKTKCFGCKPSKRVQAFTDPHGNLTWPVVYQKEGLSQQVSFK